MKKLSIVFCFVLLASLMVPSVAFAAGPNDGRIVMGGSFNLATGQSLTGDLVVLGGDVTLQTGSTVDGNILVMGGNVAAAGEVTGDVSLLGGNIRLDNSAYVHGNVTSVGGNITRTPGARVDGQVTTGEGISLPFAFGISPSIITPEIPSFGARFAPIFGFIWFAFRTLILAALAVLLTLFWPNPAIRTANAVVSQPAAAGGLGLLTYVVGVPALVLIMITIILSPISLLGLLILVAASVFGWIAVGLELGRRMAEAFKWDLHTAAAAGIGVFLMTFVVGGIGLIPCVGWVVPFLVACIGLGAVILTRFGSREYLPAATSEVSAKPSRSTASKSKS